ncbi:MAG TPA: hypothetical protein VFG80_08200 [Myxococcota bacterium]|jgi:hypothetical protein|nr:hypothetical protein [Myxococcota bacterium]
MRSKAGPGKEGSEARAAAELDELQRLMAGFAGELRKLEEALRILDAYLARMRTQTGSSRGHTLH